MRGSRLRLARFARFAFCAFASDTLRLRSGICVLLNLLRFPADHWWILVLRSLVTVVRKALTSAGMAGMPTQVERRLFPSNSGKSKWWRFAQEVSCVGAENLRCGAFAFCVPFVCCLRTELCFETRRLRFAFVRSGRTPKVSCSLNGTGAQIVNYHMVSGSAKPSIEGRDCLSRLTPAAKDGAITELARLYGGGASKPITLIGGDFNLKKNEEQTLVTKLCRGLGICARPHAPAHLKLRIASSSMPCAGIFRAPLRGHRRCVFSATPRPRVRRGRRVGAFWPRQV